MYTQGIDQSRQYRLEKLLSQKSQFGLEGLINSGMIQVINGLPTLIMTPSTSYDPLIYGDCAYFALRAAKELREDFIIRISELKFEFPKVYFKGNHYVTEYLNRKGWTVLDASKFYTNMRDHAVTNEVTEAIDYQGTEFVIDLPLNNLRSFKEYLIEGRQHMSFFGVTMQNEDIILTATVFIQNDQGEIAERYENHFRVFNPDVNPDDLNFVSYTRDGINVLVNPPNHIKQALREMYLSIFGALFRGETLGSSQLA